MGGDIQLYGLVDHHGPKYDSYYKPNAALTAAKRSNFSHVNNSTSRVNELPSASKNVFVTTSFVLPT
jgi:hypothetical protein